MFLCLQYIIEIVAQTIVKDRRSRAAKRREKRRKKKQVPTFKPTEDDDDDEDYHESGKNREYGAAIWRLD